MNLSSKISLTVSTMVLAILVMGYWLIWDQLATWEPQRALMLIGVWIVSGVAVAVYFSVCYLTRPLEEQVVARTADFERSQAVLLQAARLAAVGELAAGVAHEINNPTSVILMRAEQLSVLATDTTPGQAADDLAVIRRQVDKISHIVSGLLSFSRRTESGGRRVALNVNEVVRRTAHLMDGLLRCRKVEVALDLADGMPAAMADGARIEQVLLNLANNAVDAMPDGGRMTFGTLQGRDAHEGQVAVYVADSGCGIEAEHLDRIFDPFFTTKEPGQGTGLGLSVSYSLIEQHDGAIEASSEPGKGSRFTIYLPAVSDDGPPTESPDAE
jgi:signal transduction histidine kinase